MVKLSLSLSHFCFTHFEVLKTDPPLHLLLHPPLQPLLHPLLHPYPQPSKIYNFK